MSDIDDRMSAALSAAANQVNENDLRPADPPTSGTAHIQPMRRHIRWIAPVLAAAAVVGIAIGTAAVVHNRHTAAPAGPAASPTLPRPTPATPTTISTAPDSPTPTKPTPTSSAPGGGTAVNCYFIDFRCPVPSNFVFYQPLWPFADYVQAKRWETVDGPNGHAPWHADAGLTALSFTTGYLGFRDITMVTSTSIHGDQAHIGVGYKNPNGKPVTAAVLHLVRFTPTPGNTKAGWEVVGSDDTTFSLESPAYGSRVSSPMTVGGHITGVDEAITVWVRTLSDGVTKLGPIAAGGQNAPWSETVPFTQTGVLTIVASTGGHVQQHERFAIQGVHTD